MSSIKRMSYFTLGSLSLATGLLGLVIPLLPTTVFILIAVWAYARSSQRLHDRLVNHPRFGASIRLWQAQGAIPLRAKRLAVTSLAIAALLNAWLLAAHPMILSAVLLILASVAAYVVTRPSPAGEATAIS